MSDSSGLSVNASANENPKISSVEGATEYLNEAEQTSPASLESNHTPAGNLNLPTSNQVLKRKLSSNSPTLLTPSNLLALQRRIGNNAVQRLIKANRPAQTSDTVQRKMDFQRKYLSGLRSVKARLDQSTLSQLVHEYEVYEGLQDPTAELASMNKMKSYIEAWKKKHPEPLKPADAPKKMVLDQLEKAIDKEIPKATSLANQKHFVQNIGIPASFLSELDDISFHWLVEADQALKQGNVVWANLYFDNLKAKIGDTVKLIKSFMIRYYIHKLDPEVAKALNNQNFRLDDAAKKTSSQTYIDNLAKGRARELEQVQNQPRDPHDIKAGVKIMEAQVLGPQLKDIGQAAANKKNEFASLKNLDKEEISGIVGYSSNLYGKYNSPLRNDIGTKGFDQDTLALVQTTISGLNKLKPFTGTVFRHGSIFPGFKELNREGAVVTDMGFMSSAIDQAACSNAGEDHDVLEIIKSKTGREISDASLFTKKGIKGEREVLFKPGSRFRVTKRLDKNIRTGTWAGDRGEVAQYLKSPTEPKKDQIQIIVFKEEV